MKFNRLLKVKDVETKTLFKNSSWVLSSNLIRAVLLFVRGILVARGLGVELFGTFNLIAAFATIVIQLLSFPISSTIIKYSADFLTQKNYRKLAALFKVGIYLSLFLAILSVIAVWILSIFFYDVFLDIPNLEPYVISFTIIGGSIFFDQISRSLLRILFKFRIEAYVVILSAILDLLIVGLTVFLFPNEFLSFFIALMVSKLIASLLLNIVSFYYLRDLIKGYWTTSIKVLRSESKELSGFTLSNSGSRILTTITNNGDVLLLGALVGPAPVAFYNIAKKLAQTIMIVVDPLTSSIFPQVSLLISKQKYSEVIVMIRKVTRILLLPTLIFIALFIFIREHVITIAYGVEYIDASNPFLILVINAMFSAILFWNRPLIESINLVKFRFNLNAICLIIGAVFSYLSIPSLGAVGVALGLLIANGLSSLAAAVVAYKKTKNSIIV